MTIVTGVEHSCTGLLARIVRTGVPDALHRAVPHVADGQEQWWTAADFPDARYVIALRDRVYRNRSTVARGFTPALADARRDAAMRILATLRPAIWISVEALVMDPERQVALIGDWLGVELKLPEPVYDCDKRWRAA